MSAEVWTVAVTRSSYICLFWFENIGLRCEMAQLQEH
jgi:hypothetical protein